MKKVVYQLLLFILTKLLNSYIFNCFNRLSDFDDMAFGILGSFDSSFPDRNNFKYLETSSDIFDMNCLEMANKSESKVMYIYYDN
jgi:hypothetical protein